MKKDKCNICGSMKKQPCPLEIYDEEQREWENKFSALLICLGAAMVASVVLVVCFAV